MIMMWYQGYVDLPQPYEVCMCMIQINTTSCIPPHKQMHNQPLLDSYMGGL